MDFYVCSICGYEYVQAVGDPGSGVSANTPFASLSNDWVCPICGASKFEFSKA
ncbi:Rubredoxin [Desulfovibrionales bacterium]